METHHCVNMSWPKEEDDAGDFPVFPPPFDHRFSTWDPISCLNMFLGEPLFASPDYASIHAGNPIPPADAGVFNPGDDDGRIVVKTENIESFGAWIESGQIGVNGTTARVVGDRPDSKSPKIEIGISSSRSLSRKKISEYFYMPITQAAKELNMGLTLLKRRCREVGIRRWPHRKLASLQTLINHVQEMWDGEEREKAVEFLEQEKKLVEETPEIELGEQTKRLRQACFKANHNKKRKMNRGGVIVSPESGSSLARCVDGGVLVSHESGYSCSSLARCVDGGVIVSSESGDVRCVEGGDVGGSSRDEYDPAMEEVFNSFLFDYFCGDYMYLV